MNDEPPMAEGWKRERVLPGAIIDYMRFGFFRKGVVWMAILSKGDGTYAMHVGRTKTVFCAKRQAMDALRGLVRQLQEENCEEDQATASEAQTAADAEE